MLQFDVVTLFPEMFDAITESDGSMLIAGTSASGGRSART